MRKIATALGLSLSELNYNHPSLTNPVMIKRPTGFYTSDEIIVASEIMQSAGFTRNNSNLSELFCFHYPTPSDCFKIPIHYFCAESEKIRNMLFNLFLKSECEPKNNTYVGYILVGCAALCLLLSYILAKYSEHQRLPMPISRTPLLSK